MGVSTRKLNPAKSVNYLKKAEELYLEMLEARRSGRFNTAVTSAVVSYLTEARCRIRKV